LHVDEVAGMLSVSSRQVYRLADGGLMPKPLKLGGSVRWDRKVVEDWVAAGCPSVMRGRR